MIHFYTNLWHTHTHTHNRTLHSCTLHHIHSTIQYIPILYHTIYHFIGSSSHTHINPHLFIILVISFPLMENPEHTIKISWHNTAANEKKENDIRHMIVIWILEVNHSSIHCFPKYKKNTISKHKTMMMYNIP